MCRRSTAGYYANTKSWISSNFYEKLAKYIDIAVFQQIYETSVERDRYRCLSAVKPKSLLIVGNCTAHECLWASDNPCVVSLTKWNFTYKANEQSIINKFKQKYERLLL